MTGRRVVPVGAVVCMVAALLWLPGIATIWQFVDGPSEMGFMIFVPGVLGLLGGLVATCDRRLDGWSRLGWATTSITMGLLALPLWWTVGISLWGF